MNSNSFSSSSFRDRLWNSCHTREFADILIKIGDYSIWSHRLVLANSSPVLRQLIVKGRRSANEKGPQICEISEQFIDAITFAVFIGFFYTEKIILTVHNLCSIYRGAQYLQVPAIVSQCEDFLKNVSDGNVLTLFFSTVKHELTVWKEHCLNCILTNRTNIFKSDKFFNLGEQNLKTLLKELMKNRNDAKVNEDIYLSAIGWVQHEETGRRSLLNSLLRYIPPTEISFEFTKRVIKDKSIIAASHLCSTLLVNVLDKIFANRAYNLYCFGAQRLSKSYISTVSKMDPFGKWHNLTKMSAKREYFAGAVIANKVYFCGGAFCGTLSDIMEVFDCSTQEWTKLRSMPEPRWDCAAASLNGYIYVAGGEDNKNNMLSSVVRYNVKSNKWEKVASMKETRNGHQLVELNGRLYAICGFDTNTVEQYNPTTDEWKMVTSSEYKHYEFGACSHNGNIYVCSLNGLEVYCPESNTWKILPQFHKLWGQRLVSMNGKLLALGGEDLNDECGVTSSVWCYDPSNEQWIQMPDMDFPRSRHYSVVVKA